LFNDKVIIIYNAKDSNKEKLTFDKVKQALIDNGIDRNTLCGLY
jgi:hypothetical protein